jgi:hypothetical protein
MAHADTDALLVERGKTHGHFPNHAAITQLTKQLWRQAGVNWGQLTTAEAEALDMIAHKVGRILSGNPHFHDHWADIAGYARLVEQEALKMSNPTGNS